MTSISSRGLLVAGGLVLGVAAAGTALTFDLSGRAAQSAAAPAPIVATPVSVAAVQPRSITLWDEFSGRLEAIDRVEIRSRVSGAILQVHFREGAMVQRGDRLVTIDPAPYAAAVERLDAQVVAAEARVALTRRDQDRGQSLVGSGAMSQRDVDLRVNAFREAEASLRAARAALRSAQLDLGYTEITAPVAGRVGRQEITVGNLVAAGAGTPLLTTLVSVNPIYASFEADEQSVARALHSLPAGIDPRDRLDQVPVELSTIGTEGTRLRGHLQLVDNAVDTRSGTIRLRAVFDNPDGLLIPGQFARLRLGQATATSVLLVNERAVGTDQDRKFVMVVDDTNHTVYREVALGSAADGLRVVTSGLKPGERIVVNGLQRVRPGALVAPQPVAMKNEPGKSVSGGRGAQLAAATANFVQE
jgi:multidrug efflux system membrane fusion protein